jgi:Minor capsid protein
MTPPIIETPRGSITINGANKAELKWSTNFQPKWQGNYSAAQKFVDSEVLRLCEPYTPLRTGMLVKSSILGTDVGSGTVQWIAPYSAAQYYGKRAPGSETGPLRGPYWFARWKPIGAAQVIAGARKIAGGG